MKKKKMFVKILKIIGICTASVLGFVGLSIGVFALFGGFKEKVVSLTGMNFEQTAYVLDGNLKITNDEDPNKNGVFDTSIKLLPQNEDATKLNVILSGGNNIVTLPTGKDSKVGQNLMLKLETLTDDSGLYNKGGEFTLFALQEEDLLTTNTKVFVESRINSFNLSTSVDKNAIYPGTKFTVNVNSIMPSNALLKPTSNGFYSYYGEEYFNKQFLFFSSNESVASVNMFTGEVEVLSEGSFFIYAYVPTTYKNNSILPNLEDFDTDADYFAVLEDVGQDGQAFTIKRETESFTSKPINVSGITASKSIFTFNINQPRKYAFNNQYNSNDNKLDLNINLLAPENSNYKDEQLNYKFADIQIFEGYKNSNNEYFIKSNQTYNNNVLQTDYFDIAKNANPLYFTITAIDHTSKDLYLIARISNNQLEGIGESDILCVDQSIDSNGDYVYYAFIDVETAIIQNESINLTTNKILGSFTQNLNNNYLLNGSEMLDLSEIISNILPENSTYHMQKDEEGKFKYIKFYVDNNENDIIETTTALENAKEEIPFVILNAGENNETKGYFVKANKEGTVKFYVAIGKQGRTDTNFEELFASNYVTLVITQTITFSDFKIDGTKDDDSDTYNLIKGNNLTIEFKTDNPEGFLEAYQEGFFVVASSITDKALVNVDLPSNDGVVKLQITGINEGSTKLYIYFNGLYLNYLDLDSKYVTFEGVEINVKDNALTSITLNSAEINQNNEINFVVNPESTALQFITQGNTIVDESKPLKIDVEIHGGNDDTTLTVNYSSTAVEMNIVKDTLNTNKFILSIIPKVLCENVEFYIGSTSSSVTSQIIKINIRADYQILTNYNNSIIINSNNCEQVIGGEVFELQPKLSNESFFKYQTSTGIIYDSNLFEVSGNRDIDTTLYVSNKFNEVLVPTQCEIKVKPKFSEKYEIYYFYIMPKIYITTSSLNVDTEDTLDLSTLEGAITLNQRDYDSDKNIVTSSINTGLTKTIYSVAEIDPNGKIIAVDESNKITSYTVNTYELDKASIELYCKVEYDGKEYLDVINVVVNSSIEIKDSIEYLDNGKEIPLNDLFKIWNIKSNTEITTESINVTFTKNTIDALKVKGITFYNDASLETNPQYFISSKTNNFTSILIPENISDYMLNDLTANISVVIEGNTLTKENHKFDLSFRITSLQINENYLIEKDGTKNIYILNNDTVNFNNFNYLVLNSSVSTIDESNINQIPTVEKIGNQIKFTLNSIVKTFGYIEIPSFASKSENTQFYVGKAYLIEELITINPDLSIEYFNLISVTLNDESTTLDYSIEDKRLIIKKADSYIVSFTVLGRTFNLNYTFNDLTINVNELDINGNLKAHSNLNYNLLTESALKTLYANNINVNFEIIVDNIELLNYISIQNKTKIIDKENYLMPTLVIGNYSFDKDSFKIKATFSTTGFTGASKLSDEITLFKLIINQNYTETTTDGNGNIREVILNKYNHILNNYFEVIQDFEDDTELSYYQVKEGEVTETQIIPSQEKNIAFSNSTRFDIVIKIAEKEVKRIYFYAQNFLIEKVASQPSYYAGQTLSREDLLALIKVVDENNVPTSKYNKLIKFVSEGEEITELIINSTSTYLEVFISDDLKLIGGLTIEASLIAWSVNLPIVNDSAVIYNDTKIYNYVSAKVNENELILNYKPCTDEGVCSVTDSVLLDDVYYLYNGNILIAKLNKITGELAIEQNALPSQNISVIPYIASSLVEYSTPIIFTIQSITPNSIKDVLNIYVGDNTTSLDQCGNFSGAPSDAQLRFKISSNQVLKEDYSYHLNNKLDRYEILKNGIIVAYISGSNFICTSLMDSMSLKVEGYLYINTTNGYTIESLGNITLPVTLDINKINIALDLEEVTAEGKKYYVIQTKDIKSYTLQPKENGEDRYFSELIFKDAFIAKDTKSGSDDNFKRLLNLTPEEKTLKLPNGYKLEITDNNETNKTYSISWESTVVVDYIFTTLEYTYGSYSDTLNLAFVPEYEIVFNYEKIDFEEDEIPYANVVSPAEYAFNDSGILFGINIDLLDRDSVTIKPYLQEEDFSKEGNFRSTFSQPSYKYALNYSHADHGVVLIISKNENASANALDTNTFIIKVELFDESELTKYSFIYKIIIVDMSVSIQNEGETVSESNPIVLRNEDEIDLKEYIYINNIKATDVNATGYESIALHVENIQFKVSDENLFYELSKEGIFTPLKTIVDDLQIEFSLYGTKYFIYLAGENTEIIFNGNYNLSTGQTYYVDITKQITTDENEEENVTITTNISTNRNESVTELAGSLNLSNFNYTLAGNSYNENYFTTIISNNITTIKFGAQTFVQLIKYDNYYEIVISSTIAGSLSFDIKVLYSNKIESKNVNIYNEDLIVSYIEPSVVEGQTYQNMLSNTTLNLNNFISGFDKNNSQASFALAQYSTKANINNGILTPNSDIYNDVYLKIEIKVNNLTNYFYVRIIPETKYEIANTSKEFYVIKGEAVNLTNFVKVFKFSRLDAQNEPLYEQVLAYSFIDDKDTEEESDDEILEISLPTAYTFTDSLKIKIDDLIVDFNVIDLILSDLTIDKGKNLDIKTKIQEIVSASNLTYKDVNLRFSNENNFVDGEGVFLANFAGIHKVKVYINNVEFEIDIIVNELEISINYLNALAKEEENVLVKYQNIYATQTINRDDLIKTVLNNVEFPAENLQFSIEVLNSNSYDISSELKVTTLLGVTELRDAESQLLFTISKDKIKCYPYLKGEIFLKVYVTIEGNTLVENELNIRLLPVELKVETEKNINYSYTVNNKYELLNNVVTAKTNAESNNINLNNVLSFSIKSDKNELGATLVDTSKLEIYSSRSNYVVVEITLGSGDNALTKTSQISFSSSGTSQTREYAISITNENTSNPTIELPSDFSIKAVRDAINVNGNDYYYTYNETIGIISYEVFNNNNQKVITILSNGNYTRHLNSAFAITIEAYGYNQTISKVVAFAQSSNWDVNYNLIDNKIVENGVQLIQLFSEQEIEVDGLLNDGDIESLCNLEYEFKDGKTYIKAINTNDIVYGYFDAVKDSVNVRIYVKIIPCSIEFNYIEDYVFEGATVQFNVDGNLINVIYNNSKYKTENISSEMTINLEEYISIPNNESLKDRVQYSISNVVAYDAGLKHYSHITDSGIINFCELEDGQLTLKAKGVYYVHIKAKIGHIEKEIKLRVLQIYRKSENDFESVETTNDLTLDVNVGDVIDLSYVDIIAPNEKDSGSVTYTENSLLSNLTFQLQNSIDTYLKDQFVYVLDNNDFIIQYIYKDKVLCSINVNVISSNNYDDIYLYGGKNYKEEFYSNTNTDILENGGEKLSNVSTVMLNGVNYLVRTETRVGKRYFIVDNQIEICEDGIINFYDNVSKTYIPQNKIGIFYICVIKSLDYGFRQEYYKLNNYNIDFENKTYFINGSEDRSDLLRYSLVLNNGLAINNSVITDSTISANGVTLNFFNGSYTGSLTSDMKIKVYVQEDYRFYGDKFIIGNN